MKAQNKAQTACDVSVYSDKGSLALRFPKRHNALWELLDGKSLKGKPKCLGIGKYGYSDTPEDWKRATQLAAAMEADLDHPEWDKLFDPTLAKYGLGGGKYAKLADVLQMPGTVAAEPEITVGEMWEAYLEWKRTVIEETTFKTVYCGITNAINGKVWDKVERKFLQSDTSLHCIELSDTKAIKKAFELIVISKKDHFINSLNQAFDFCKTKGVLQGATENPFLLDKYSEPTVTTQQKYASKVINGEEKEWHEVQDENHSEIDRRSFTKKERDIIIKAFYESNNPTDVRYAPLIEFYFLTGCRTSEALPLTWKDIDFERNVIRFSKSLGKSTGKVKETKTGEVRLFYFSVNSRLRELLLKLKSESSNTLIFHNKRGTYISQSSIRDTWHKSRSGVKTLADGTTTRYHYPGIVTQLAEQGAISGYLPQYHTRHTYITLTAQANAHNNNALLHIATACGNSVDVILRHYLGVDESVELLEV